MCPRVCISLFILQMLAAFVSCEGADDCISVSSNTEHSLNNPTILTLKCQIEQCKDVNSLRPQNITISVIGEEGNSILLASIEKIKNVASRYTALGEKPKVSGNMKDNRNTYLAIEWDDADKDQDGQYACVIVVTDKSGKRKNLDAMTFVVVNEDAETTVETTVTEGPSSSKMTMETCKAQFPELKDGTETLAELKEKVVKNFFLAPLAYNKKTYYLSLQPYIDDAQSDEVCGMLGGYLAEINDANEYQAMVKYLKSYYNNPGALISGTDAKKEGVWVYQRSQRPVTYFNWGAGEPNNANGGENCIIIWPTVNYLAVDAKCHDNLFWKFLYICEVDG